MWASESGHTATVRWLVEVGHAEVNHQDMVSRLLDYLIMDCSARCRKAGFII